MSFFGLVFLVTVLVVSFYLFAFASEMYNLNQITLAYSRIAQIVSQTVLPIAV